jgi:hypothetical protein
MWHLYRYIVIYILRLRIDSANRDRELESTDTHHALRFSAVAYAPERQLEPV